jgi:hypothetical protein
MSRSSHTDLFIDFFNRKKTYIVALYFILLFLLGLFTFRDYGISFDEPVSRTNGGVSLRYVADKLDINFLKNDSALAVFNIPLKDYYDRDYGVAFDLTAFFIERIFLLDDSRHQYLLRHFLTFLVFYIGVIAIYKLATMRFNHWGYGILAATMLVTSPRIYGEAFYNNKDIVFLGLCSACAYTMLSLQRHMHWRTAVLHGLVTAVAINVRVAGVIFLPLTLIALAIAYFNDRLTLKKLLVVLFVYGVASAIFTYALWPWLWENPIRNFLFALKNMSQFRWDHFNLYMGEYVSAKNLPWHYVPVWIAITTPILFGLGFILGVFSCIVSLVKLKLRAFESDAIVQDLMLAGVTCAPLIATYLFNSTLYDGWRQLYFLYPSMIVLAITGFRYLSTWHIPIKAHISKLIVGLVSIQILFNAAWMIKAHPFQHAYFNQLVRNRALPSFELDYWGLTNLQALKFILVHDSRERITIAPIGATALEQSILMLESNERPRIRAASTANNPDYFITNYRFFESRKTQILIEPPNYSIFHTIDLDNRRLLTVFKKKINTPE